jgi:hypothetical protein
MANEYIDATKNHNPVAVDPNDDRLLVEFSEGAVHNPAKSEVEGRPVYDSVPWIRIIVPGNRDTVEREAREADKTRFPKHWAAYVNKTDQVGAAGTPLAMWPQVTRAQVEEMAHFGTKTVEQLAGMSDARLQGFMGGQQLRQRAKDFIEAAKGAAPMNEMRAELEKRDAELAALKAQVAELAKNKK